MKKLICTSDQSLMMSESLHLVMTKSCNIFQAMIPKKCAVKLYIEFEKLDDISVRYEFILEEKSSLEVIPLYFTDQTIETKFSFVLRGNYASVEMKGLAVLASRDAIKIETSQKHLGQHTRSIVEVGTLAAGRSTFDYEGIIYIDKLAFDTFANQQNKNIMLSETATVKSIPTIEVLNKNVQCFHGSAIGTFDKEQMWYLQSRGLDMSSVKSILIDSFCKPILNLVPWKKEALYTIKKKLVEVSKG